jgi:hypothetical protein
MNDVDRCLQCQRFPATRLAIPSSGRRYFCSARCAAAWAVGELDRRRDEAEWPGGDPNVVGVEKGAR